MTSVLDMRRSVPSLTLLVTMTSQVLGMCRFPPFLQKNHPWAGDYREGPLVAYVKPSVINLREDTEGGRSHNFKRECIQRTTDNKYLVMHTEYGQHARYLCMQFLQRGENIVQVKTSNLYARQSLELCDEKGMVIDPFPLVQLGQNPDSSGGCPFTGGYNLYAHYAHPNDSIVCSNLFLLMRLESECDRGEGIIFDFKSEDCVPKGLPRKQIQRAHCVAHWTQESYTFIILQVVYSNKHAEEHNKWFCLRTSDPLNNIKSAYLWLKVICDTSDKPSPDISTNYLRLELNKRIFSSTCEDELELCSQAAHYCTHTYKQHCALTCRDCKSENEIGVCTFEEHLRGRWIESNTNIDMLVDVEAYSLDAGQRGRYDCIDLQSKNMTEKRVLLELYNNGCFPRYACVEMMKVTSSVMKFRLGNRLTWPLKTPGNLKEEICKPENFQIKDRLGSAARERPARVLVNSGYIKEVNCGLPERLQKGIAFREVGKHCGGCLNYDANNTHFIVSPVNCSTESNDNKGYHNIPIQYSCLATFQFYNNTYSVVTKTASFVNGMGQYLVWIFTPENHITVLKAADTYVFALNSLVKSDLIQAQFSILRNDKSECRTLVFLPRSTTTTTAPPPEIPTEPHFYPQNGYVHYNHSLKGVGPSPGEEESATNSPYKDQNMGSQMSSPADQQKFGQIKNDARRGSGASVLTLLCCTGMILLVNAYRTHKSADFFNIT